MKNDFYFKYFGNKRTENKFLEPFLPYFEENIKTIVEPFGGSCSFSRWHFNINTRGDFEYYVNDANRLLTLFCNNFRYSPELIVEKAKDVEFRIKNSDNPKQSYRDSYNNLSKDDTFLCLEDHLAEYLYHQKSTAKGWKGYYFTGKRQSGRCTFDKYLELVKYTNMFFTKNHYYNNDYKLVFDMFKNDEKALIYLDPPYYNTDDSMYLGSDTGIDKIDHDEIMKDIYELFNEAKCKIIFVIKSDFMIDTLLKDYLLMRYNKKYETNKNTCQHSVFTNFKI